MADMSQYPFLPVQDVCRGVAVLRNVVIRRHDYVARKCDRRSRYTMERYWEGCSYRPHYQHCIALSCQRLKTALQPGFIARGATKKAVHLHSPCAVSKSSDVILEYATVSPGKW